MKKTCKDCGETKDISQFFRNKNCNDGHLNSCKQCDIIKHRKYYATDKYRSSHKKWRTKNLQKIRGRHNLYVRNNPIKNNARSLLAQAIIRGKLVRKPCVVCGSDKLIEAHHPDYSKPLHVIWLCRKHHRQFHFNRLTIL